MSVILALGRPSLRDNLKVMHSYISVTSEFRGWQVEARRSEDGYSQTYCKFQASLGYSMSSCIKKNYAYQDTHFSALAQDPVAPDWVPVLQQLPDGRTLASGCPYISYWARLGPGLARLCSCGMSLQDPSPAGPFPWTSAAEVGRVPRGTDLSGHNLLCPRGCFQAHVPPLLGVNWRQVKALLGHRSSEEARCFSSPTHSTISLSVKAGPLSPLTALPFSVSGTTAASPWCRPASSAIWTVIGSESQGSPHPGSFSDESGRDMDPWLPTLTTLRHPCPGEGCCALST